MKKVLNLYAGLGGNRKLWGDEYKVTAVEKDINIGIEYKKLYPNDLVLFEDAHEYLLNHYHEYDIIWSSPPCQSHSKMVKATRHDIKKYPDMSLYQEILLLQHFFKGDWVVENVNPYYDYLIPPTNVVGRHAFWSNRFFLASDVSRPTGFINKSNLKSKKEMMDWLGIYVEKNLYYDGNHCPCQVFRNCVHPQLGLQIIQQVGS